MNATINLAPAASINPSSATLGSASLPSSRMAARDRAQSWRGKYLRALNICPEDDVTKNNSHNNTNGKNKLRSLSYHRSDHVDRNSLSRSYSSSTEKEAEERKSLERSSQQQQQQHGNNTPSPHDRRIQAVPLRAPSRPAAFVPNANDTTSPYGFVMKPALARGRRCHTDPFLFEERTSAPIQIPNASAVVNQLDGNMRHDSYVSSGHRMHAASPVPVPVPGSSGANKHRTSSMHVPSWEEPVAMDPASKPWNTRLSMDRGVRRESMSYHGNNNHDEALDDHMDDEDEDEDDDDVHGGDIFEMEGLHDSDDDTNNNNNNSQARNAKSRRRSRTASLNIVSSGREKRAHHSYMDDAAGFDGMASNRHQQQPMVFVPPHEMVERDCFSLGLRDGFKRRPANNI